MKYLVVLAFCVFIISGCNTGIIFKEYNSFDDVSWNRFDIQNFEFTIEGDKPLNLYLAIRHHTDFPFDFIDVNITIYTPDGEMRSREYHHKLKNENLQWKGDGMGEIWDIELPIRKNMIFNKGGICKVSIENKMTKSETPGIIEIGLIVKKAKS